MPSRWRWKPSTSEWGLSRTSDNGLKGPHISGTNLLSGTAGDGKWIECYQRRLMGSLLSSWGSVREVPARCPLIHPWWVLCSRLCGLYLGWDETDKGFSLTIFFIFTLKYIPVRKVNCSLSAILDGIPTNMDYFRPCVHLDYCRYAT